MQQKSPKSRLILLILFIIPIINPLSIYGFYAGRRLVDIIRILLFGLIIVLDTDNTVSTFAALAWLVITIFDFFLIILGKFKDRNNLCISSFNPKKDYEKYMAEETERVREEEEKHLEQKETEEVERIRKEEDKHLEQKETEEVERIRKEEDKHLEQKKSKETERLINEEKNIQQENEKAAEQIKKQEGVYMNFSDIIEQLGSGTWKIGEGSPLIYEISKYPIKIQFFLEDAKVSCGGNTWDISLSEFSKFSFTDLEETDSNGVSIEMSKMFFEETELYKCKAESMQTYKELVEKLIALFSEGIECSPKAQIKNSIESFCLNANDNYNVDLYKALLIYDKRMENAFNNGFLHENSSIIVFLEENSGELLSNLGQTAKKGFGKIMKGGFGGLISAGIDIAKAAGSRVTNSIVGDWAGKSFMLLTNKNVILLKPDEINEYDFEDASEIFKARQDETLAGVVDIYDDSENKILDNIDQTKWNIFKTQLRKVKKESATLALESSSTEEEIDEYAEAEKKITKLKKMLDNGLISQEDFDSKKSDILSAL